ncbi:MAG: hypothetical protein RLZZ338_1890 [Cyanobacteriota bacterium]|jgi:opacity protein-like surface antigen
MNFIPHKPSSVLTFLLLLNGGMVFSQGNAIADTLSPSQSHSPGISETNPPNQISPSINLPSSQPSQKAIDLIEDHSYKFVPFNPDQSFPNQLPSEISVKKQEKSPFLSAQTDSPNTSNSPNNTTNTSQASPWRVEIIPYFFVPFSLNGTAKFGSGETVNFDGGILRDEQLNGKRFSWKLNSVNILPIALRGQAWNNNLGILFDGQYYGFGTNSSINFRDQERRKIYSTTNITSIALGVGWKVATLPLTDSKNLPISYSGQPYPSLAFKVLGGGRYGSLYQEIDLSPGPQVSINRSWLAPMIGGEIALQFSQNLGVGLWTDYSGFGISGLGSTFNVKLGLDWNISPGFSVRPGYRFYSFDYKEKGTLGERGLNVSANGIDLGFVFSF